MTPPRLSFIWHETLLELRRERLVAVTTISTVAVLFLLLGANLLFVLSLHGWARRAAEEVSVYAYFRDQVERAEAQQVATSVANWSEVRSVRFVPREESWQQLVQTYGADKLRGLGPSVVQDSVEVKVKQPTLMPAVSERLAKLSQVKDVNPPPGKSSQSGSFVASVVQFNRIVGLVGLIVAGLVALVGTFVVYNTIRLAMHARWRETYIMQLVGATRALIAAPFLLQGAIQGAIGAALAACVLVPMYMYVSQLILHSGKTFLQLQPDAVLVPFTVHLILAGMILGLLGSALSVRRTLQHRPEWQS